jgi:hypothetical protein
MPPLSRKKELEKLRKEIRELKIQKGAPAVPVNEANILSGERLRNKTVAELRRLVVDNKLFKGISKMNKRTLISKIMDTSFYASHSQALPKGKRPTIKSELTKARQKARTLKLKLDDVRKKRKPKKGISDELFTQLQQENIELGKKKKSIPEKKTPSTVPSAPPIQLIPKPKIGVPTAPPLPPAAPPPAPPIKEKVNTPTKVGEKAEPKIEVSKDGKHKKVDVGNTIINMYCGGSGHPDFPVPQSVVRHALASQALPEREQRAIHRELKKVKAPKFQGIPREVIPKAVPHKTHTPSKMAKRFKAVEPVRRPVVEKKAAAAPADGEAEIDPLDAEDSDDDVVEVKKESNLDKIRRLKQEELAKVAAKGKRGKKKRDAVRAKLENIFKDRVKK